MMMYTIAVTFSVKLRADWVELPVWWQLGMAGLWIVGMAVPVALLIVPANGRVGGHWRAASVIAMGMTALFCAIGWFHPSGPSSFSYAEAPLRGHGCMQMGLAIAIIPALAVAFVLRGVYPTTSRIVAASIGAAAGSIGGLVLHFHCRVTDGLHLLLFHGGMVVAASFIVAVAAPLLLDLPWNHRRHNGNSKAAS
jgi:Negative regulator of sigma F